jgi:photosystem II stability/assembly factor-like uncharacterized protein
MILVGCNVNNAPVSVSPWTEVSVFTGMNVTSIAATPAFVYVSAGPLYRSTDAGGTWSVCHPENFNVVRASDDLVLRAYRGFKLSTDAGTTWSDLLPGFFGKVLKLSVSTSAILGNNLFAGMEEDGVFRSTNGGASWFASSTGLESPMILSLVAKGDTLFACASGATANGVLMRGGLFRSIDRGSQWAPCGLVGDSLSVTDVAWLGTVLFAGTSDRGLFVSSNGGTTWAGVNSILPETSINALLVTGSTCFAGTANHGVWQSNDQGQNWSPIPGDSPRSDITSLAATGQTLWVGTKSGVWKYRLR